MGVAGIFLFGIITSIFAISVKTWKPEYSIYMVAVCVCMLFSVVIVKLKTVLSALQTIEQSISVDHTSVSILVKIIGISYLTQFSSDLCKDCGYPSLANQLRIFGKITVLAVSLPIVLSLLETMEHLF